jgi:hypothetical protein
MNPIIILSTNGRKFNDLCVFCLWCEGQYSAEVYHSATMDNYQIG